MERVIHENVQRGLQFAIPDINSFFDRLEKQWEEELIKTFADVGIRASVKEDKHSLPHQGEVVIKCHQWYSVLF